eukprot:TRINITY_DN2709_c0_g1_i2.p1 TRINITY_DN2709_c0_g1~~TRINITY_DN2709_c0_g1_i2.p1  ORF type:complete len:190 (-),score=29.92 TRINITY_DN2709_c0_g1_i2:578-1147(-)
MAASQCFIVITALLAVASVAQADRFDAYLYGSNVVSNVATPSTANGDLDGTGSSVVTVTGSQICLTATWANLATVTRYHIHKEAFGNRGPVVVNWVDESTPNAFPSNTGNSVTTCAINNAINNSTAVTPALIADILANPAGYYVDLHTPETRVINGVTVRYSSSVQLPDLRCDPRPTGAPVRVPRRRPD